MQQSVKKVFVNEYNRVCNELHTLPNSEQEKFCVGYVKFVFVHANNNVFVNE